MTGARNVERGVNDGAARLRAHVVEGPCLRGDGVALPDRRRFVTFGACSSVSRRAATLRRLIGVPAAAIAVVVGLLAGPLAASSSAAGTLDQSQPDTLSAVLSLVRGLTLAQTFTAGRSGPLRQVDLFLLNSQDVSGVQGPVTVQIRDAFDGAPSSTVRATTTVPASDLPPSSEGAWVAAHFDAPATVQAETQYAIVAFTSDGWALWKGTLSTDAYPGGGAFAMDSA